VRRITTATKNNNNVDNEHGGRRESERGLCEFPIKFYVAEKELPQFALD
jgi:hypothetical protein